MSDLSTASVSIEELLQTTSRTFALSIPLLPKPLDQQVTLAYLVFRIADTIEDADHLSRDERCESLHQFHDILLRLPIENGNADDSADIASWSSRFSDVSENDDYNRLVAETGRVLRLVSELDSGARKAIQRHARRSVMGMKETLHRADVGGNLTLTSVDQLRQYCYYVAGIVGEMITELFLQSHESQDGAASLEESKVSTLQRTAAAFGEALQLVNILKDSGDDAICGRSYLPPDVPRDQIHCLADERIADAEQYVQALRSISATPGMIAFCDAPLQLAKRTLEVVAEHGPGSKITRDETFALLQDVMERAGFAT